MSRYKTVLNELVASDYILNKLQSRIKEYESRAGYAHFVLKSGKEFSNKFTDLNDAKKLILFLNEAELIESYVVEAR